MKRKKQFFAGLKPRWFSAVVALWLAGDISIFAQVPLSNLVVAVGTTIQSTNGQNWSYMLIGSEVSSLIAGKQFAVFGKNGYPTNTGTFTQRGTMLPQTSVATINTLLNQSVVLRDDLTALNNALNVVLRNVSGATNQSPSQKMAAALQLAKTDSEMRSTLGLLGRNHPGVLLCSGLAFSEVITGVTTYEIREINPGNGVAGDVLGRVTVVPGNPVVLPAPGFPFQMQDAGMAFRDNTNNSAERLKIYLRWGTPPELRRLALLSYGFNVWRMTNTVALQNSFNLTPPTLAQLYANATMANDSPVLATRDFAAADPGNLSDPTTFFFADDNGRKFGLPAFTDGAKYYYFITARDLLGRDGFVSAGSPATACRRLPPEAPTGLKIKNVLAAVSVGGVNTNQPRLRLDWVQNTDTNDNVAAYGIYLWDNPASALTNDVSGTNHLIATVPQRAGTNANQFLVDGANLPIAASVSNYWFTVRAVSQAACGPLFSPHSPPAWGVLRERQGPAAATGKVFGSCGTPVVMFQNLNAFAVSGNTNGQFSSYRLTCQRRDSGIAWVLFTLTSGSSTNVIGPVQFPPDGDTVSADITVPNNFASPLITNQVVCAVGDFEDNNSPPATNIFVTDVTVTNAGQENIFLAGELLLTALNASDPLLAALNGGFSSCSETFAVTPHADGTVSMRFYEGGNLNVPRLVQVLTSNIWTDVGVARPDTNQVYWIHYPACLIGPLPTFRGCIINVPGAGDCDQHITSAGGTVAPIIVSFQPTPRSREYRLYRRMDDGPASLVAQGATTDDPSQSIVIPDDAMPPSAAHLCYYVQMLDEHGNGSPLALLGCEYAKPVTLPRPVLAEPKPIGDTNHPQVLLNWFCPVAGVHRFQINISRDDHTNRTQATGLIAPQLSHLFTYDNKKIYAGLFPGKLRYLVPGEAQVTPPISSGLNGSFGPGPQFSLTADVVAGGTYSVTVSAVDDHDKAYNASDAQTFTWKMINTNLVTVPWPARPLPAVTHFDDDNGSTNLRVAAVVLRYDTGNVQTFLDPRYPVGIRIGSLNGAAGLTVNGGVTFNVGNTNFFHYLPAPSEQNPTRFLFTRHAASPDRNGEPLLPIVVYRQQVASSAFPKVSGNVMQVTPLLEKLAWRFFPHINGSANTPPDQTVVYDLLIAAGSELITQSGTFAYSYNLYVRDQQPVLIGASYHYYVVRFNAKHEVAETIDAGTVTIPPN